MIPRSIIKINTEDSTLMEKFQSETLRPILKQKNETILIIFKNHLIQKKIAIVSPNEEEKLTFISNLLKNDSAFKSFFIGLIVSEFNNNELQLYILNSKEINKRITALLIERVRSQWEKVG